jgi:hypothetical protein
MDDDSFYRCDFNFMPEELYNSLQDLHAIAPYNARHLIYLGKKTNQKIPDDANVYFEGNNVAYTPAELDQIFHN